MKSTIPKTSTDETDMKQNDIKYDVKILNKAGGGVKWMYVIVRMHLNLKLSFKNNHLHMNIYSGGEGNGTPLQYSCLENPMGREAW